MSENVLPSRARPQGSIQSRESIHDGRMAGQQANVAFAFLQLAEVLDVNTNADGRWDGFLNIRLLTMEGTREKVKMCIPASGNGVFAGGPPEEHAILLLGWLPVGRPVVIAAVPISIEALFQNKDLPDLVPGEYLIRSGVVVDGIKVGGASILWDRYGRVIIKDREERIDVTVGPLLDANGDVETSPETGEPLRLRVRARDASGDTLLKLEVDDGGGLRLEARRVDFVADELNVGEDVGDRNKLVTQGWVQDIFDGHGHASSAPGHTIVGPSTAVIPTAPMAREGLTEVLRSK